MSRFMLPNVCMCQHTPFPNDVFFFFTGCKISEFCEYVKNTANWPAGREEGGLFSFACCDKAACGFGVDPRTGRLSLRPEQVEMERAAQGFVGELSEMMSKIFDGIQKLDDSGVLVDTRPAAAEAGRR